MVKVLTRVINEPKKIKNVSHCDAQNEKPICKPSFFYKLHKLSYSGFFGIFFHDKNSKIIGLQCIFLC